jgi:DNA polymerase III alpha subunit
VARGSAANSLVVYALGLSSIDPLEHDLYFERFLNLSRSDCPDIDLDVCWRRRDEVLDYVYTRYGAGHVAMLATHATYQAKSAFRDVAKAWGLSPAEVNRLSKLLPHYGATGIRDAIASFPECRAFPVNRPGMADILEMSELLDGYPRHLSVHVGGVVIADRPLTDYVPLERAAKGVLITQYDMGPVEKLGLVKMDILAQRSLTIIEDTLRMVEANHGVRVEPATIADGDEPTARTLRAGRTIGCFQIESPGMRNLLKMMKARSQRDVIHALSLIRPGPASSGMKERFVRRRLGLEPTEYADARLREVLGETCGVMLYQEDVLRVAHVMAGFSLERADELRKAMTKERSGRRMEELREEFLRGVLRGGGSRRLAETLWEQVANFAGYSYCKAHACTYGYISYQAVWLKSRWPAEFLAAVLANQAGYYEQREYLEEARRWGVPIRPPDVNRSEIECVACRDVHLQAHPPEDRVGAEHPPYNSAERRGTPCGCPPTAIRRAAARAAPTTAESLVPQPVGLRVGLRHVRSLTAQHVAQMVEERRKNGPYHDLADLVLRVDLSKEETENLILSGALDALGPTRPELLWQLDMRYASLAAGRGGELFRAGEENKEDHVGAQHPPCKLPDYAPPERLGQEEYALALTPSAHPLAVLRAGLGRPDLVLNNRLDDHVGKEVTIAGILVASRRARTKTGEFMKFISLEDETGLVECVLFPEAYQRYGHLLIRRGPYLARGRVENQHGAVTLAVSELQLADAPTARGA